MKKPSGEEQEYFAREEALKIRLKAEELEREREEEAKEALRRLHYLHCPKCGSDLTEVLFRGVTLDRCLRCKGVWLDEGELETLAGDDENGLMHQLLKTLFG